jgi:hypothetical protein
MMRAMEPDGHAAASGDCIASSHLLSIARMSSRLLCLIIAMSSGVAWAQLAENATWIAAQQAMREGVFEVAGVKAARLLENNKWNAKSRKQIASLAVESAVRAGDGAKALHLLDTLEADNGLLWRGYALLLTGNADAATQAFEQAGESPHAKIALAHALVGDGREGRARTVLRVLRDHGDGRGATCAADVQ